MKLASEKQIAANRRNATKSTGPRTPDGKARSRMNSFRHGLSGPVVYDGTLAGEAVKGSDSEADREQREIAAHSFLHRIQRERVKILSKQQGGWAPLEIALRRVAALERYERRAFTDRKLALKGGPS
jgi:hypothetical protein